MVAIIGDRDSILPFKAFGIETFEVADPSQVSGVIDEMEPGRYDIIFATEDVLQGLEKIGKKPALNIVPIPGRKGSTGYGKSLLKELIRKAVGAEVK